MGGWQISGTVILQTGNPFSVYGDQANYSLAQNSATFPNWVPGVSWKPAHQGINEWFNPAAFSKPQDGTAGNVRRNSLYGPGLNVFNMSAAKAFAVPWREGMRFEFRVDAQNVFNHPSFGQPNNMHLGNSAGPGLPYSGTSTITSLTVQGRNLQLGMRFTF